MNRDKCKRALFLCVKYLVSAAVVAVVVGPLLDHAVHIGENTGPARLHLAHPAARSRCVELGQLCRGAGREAAAVAVKNTAVILVVSIFFNVLLGSVTAYCLQRFEFRFRRLVMGCFYLGMLVPTFVVEIARFKVIQSMGLYNTLGAAHHHLCGVRPDAAVPVHAVRQQGTQSAGRERAHRPDAAISAFFTASFFRFWPRQRPRSSF